MDGLAGRGFARLQADRQGFAEALRRFRATTDSADLLDDELYGLRDADAGRPVAL